MQNVPNQQIPTPPISSFGRPPSVSGGSISGSIPPVVTSQQNFGGVPPIVPKPSLIPHQQGITSHPPPPPPQQSFARNSPSPHVPGTF